MMSVDGIDLRPHSRVFDLKICCVANNQVRFFIRFFVFSFLSMSKNTLYPPSPFVVELYSNEDAL